MAPAPVAPLDEGPARESAEEALGRAKQEIGADEPAGKIARGRSWEVLLDEIALEHVTLVAVGSYGAGRARGIVIGSTATELVHKAPCSVLVARKPLKDFPGPIAVGVDGSKEAAAADAVAGALAKPFRGAPRAAREPAPPVKWPRRRGGRGRAARGREPRAARRQGARVGLRAGRARGPMLSTRRPLTTGRARGGGAARTTGARGVQKLGSWSEGGVSVVIDSFALPQLRRLCVVWSFVYVALCLPSAPTSGGCCRSGSAAPPAARSSTSSARSPPSASATARYDSPNREPSRQLLLGLLEI
jgi:Universal stress protein family